MADRPPTTVRVVAHDAASLFDRDPSVAPPRSGRSLRPEVARFLELEIRAKPRSPAVALEVDLGESPLAAGDEERLREEIRSFFVDEERMVARELRVNRVEGWGAFRTFLPLIVVALAVAGLFYIELPRLDAAGLGALLTALVYLLFITVVWVLLWDPTELLLFDAYFLRSRLRAVRKLAAASVRFRYSVPAGPGPGRPGPGEGRTESLS
jgi:hypothetical protein